VKCYVKESASASIHWSVKTCMKMHGNEGVTVLTWCTAVPKVMEMLEIFKEGAKYVVCCCPQG